MAVVVLFMYSYEKRRYNNLMNQPSTTDAHTDRTPHILVVDDDDRLRALLQRYLLEQDFTVNVADSAEQATEALKAFNFDAIILDIMMPGKDGLTLARELEGENIPILILSAKGEPEDRIVGLEAGVDDYLTKPFEPEELVLRIKSLLKRTARLREISGICAFGEFEFDPKHRSLLKQGTPVELTSTEVELLAILANQRGRAISREELAQKCKLNSERNVDTHMTRLRKKIEADPSAPQYIQTVRNVGYGLYGA